MQLSPELKQYQEQIEHLTTYIKAKGLKFETEEDLKSIMQDWINDGLKFMKQMEQPQAVDFMYKMTIAKP